MHAIVTTEQLDKSKAGHLPIIATLIRNQYFQRHIARVNVDEAHCIHIDGLSHYGQDAFRPAWGRLDLIQAILPRLVTWSLFSATFPQHILQTVEKKLLLPDYERIHATSNRPNTAYAFREVQDLDDLTNYECLLTHPFKLEDQPRILIFVDNKKLAARLAHHLSQFVPEDRRRGKKRAVRHYHSQMSERYLQRSYDEFTREGGSCKVLITTSCNAVVWER